jgi:hypothetical protein
MSMAAILVALPFVLPLVFFMMKRLSNEAAIDPAVTAEAKLLLTAIPPLIWTLLPITTFSCSRSRQRNRRSLENCS